MGSATDMKALEPIFETLFTGMAPPDFPIEAYKFQRAMPVQPDTEGEIICADREEHYSDWHHSQAALSTVSGTVVNIRIDKIGLKDAQTYIDPFITLIVADPQANILDTQDTSLAKERRPQYVVFDHQLYLNVSYEDMMRRGAAVFFEFKHYKPKKKKVSTRCWAFMELDELKRDEEVLLELYQKPTDLKKKKIKLHTEKTLYLHMVATFIRP